MKLARRVMMGAFAATALALGTRRTEAKQMPVDLSHLTPEQRSKYEEVYARMMAALNYERVTVSGEHALAELARLQSASRGVPVVVGGDEDLERIAEQFSIGDPVLGGPPGMEVRSPAQILAAAKNIRFPRDLRKWSGAYQPEDLHAPVGEWPTKVDAPETGLSVSLDLLSGKVLDKVHILIIPTANSWEVPAYLRWGDWNACPPPEYHVAALRAWHDRFGAELVGINGDTMNVRAKHMPSERTQALALARDMYGYCPDIVDQGVGSVAALAAGLATSDWWYLWWD